jgi:hypothetical protein
LPFYQKLSFNEKVSWLLTYTIGRRPQVFKKSENKKLHEGVIKGHHMIFNLNFSDNLSNDIQSVDQAVALVYSLAKLKASNTRFITNEILTYLKENIEAVTQNL